MSEFVRVKKVHLPFTNPYASVVQVDTTDGLMYLDLETLPISVLDLEGMEIMTEVLPYYTTLRKVTRVRPVREDRIGIFGLLALVVGFILFWGWFAALIVSLGG